MKHLALFSFLTLTSCASIVSGRTQRIEFLSTPPGATVSVAGQSCVTPGFLDVPRKHNEDSFWNVTFPQVPVTYSMPGYQTQTVYLERGRNSTSVVGNAFTGGIVGAVVDYNTGAVYEYSTDVVEVTLEPAP